MVKYLDGRIGLGVCFLVTFSIIYAEFSQKFSIERNDEMSTIILNGDLSEPTKMGISKDVKRALAVVLGIGCDRNETFILNNIRMLRESKNITVDCLIGSFVERSAFVKQNKSKFIRDLEQQCYVSFAPGALYQDWQRFVHPMLVSQSNYSYVIVMQDDVELLSFSLDQATQAMARYKLDMVSPLIHGATPRAIVNFTPQRAKHKIINVSSIEAFIMVFNARAWECWWDVSDHIYLARGWGSDLWMYPYCRSKHDDFNMGIIGGMAAKHHGHCSGTVGGPNAPSTRHLHPSAQLHEWVKRHGAPWSKIRIVEYIDDD
mmetsp:Transcript_26083/g.41973  ORF Transcript_26083/g.41973 Transcript_26083/m.41973 type:complete len:317 (+) Transcript_26083:179-1129(+)